jgi:O-succinylbenzoic acid--CoA ligase
MFEDRVYSFAEASTQAHIARSALQRKGISRGDLVALSAHNRPEVFFTILALLEMGATFLPIHPRLTEAERQVILDDARPALFLGVEEIAALFSGASSHARPTSNHRENSRQADSTEENEALPPAILYTSGTTENETPPLAILYTSGTTGRPKGAVLPVSAFVASAEASAQNLGWRPDDRWLLCLPLCHIGGLSVLTRCLLARRPVILQARFEPASVLRAISQQGASLLSVVPTMLAALLEADTANLLSRARALLVGGAATPQALLERCAERGVLALTTYGLTEACSQVTSQAPREANSWESGSGRPLAGVRLRVCDESGALLPAGEIGRVWVQGPTLMRGYLGHPPLAAEGLDTGDLGHLDDRGALHLAARRVDLIVTGGENVYPAEVESVLLACAGVAGAVVFGRADERWGQIVCAAVQASPGAELGEETLWKALSLRLAAFKRPRLWCWLDEIPLLSNGKIDRKTAIRLATPRLRGWQTRPASLLEPGRGESSSDR